MIIKKIRDLTLAYIGEGKVLVTACDSCGSIGMKESDVLKVPPYFVGRFTARVGIMEVLSAGAEIITLTNAVCCEMIPTGEEVIRGIKDELEAAEISDIVLTGSTEENFPTNATGVGITVIGIGEEKRLRVNNIKESCALIAVGIPKVGEELDFLGDEDIIDYAQLKTLLKKTFVYEIVPGGSKGLEYEARTLAEENGAVFELRNNLTIDVKKSCGTATSAIAAVKLEAAELLVKELKNCEVIGYIQRKTFL